MTSDLRFHSDARLVPEMRPDEFAALVNDVSERGIVVPLDVTHDGVVLDGRHRLQAAKQLGIKRVPVREIAPADATVYMLKAAVLRRNLTDGQRAIIAALYAKEHPKPTGAAAHGKSAPTGGRVASKLERHTPALAAAARLMNVSDSKARKAAALVRADKKLAESVLSGKLTLSQAVRQNERQDRRRAAEAAAPAAMIAAAGEYQCIVIDPPWSPEDEGDIDQMGRSQPLYSTISIKDMAEKAPVDKLAAADCHLYLWITNRSLPKGFALIESWGFRYITCLTWCKPSIGIGNYYRNNTEHVLFAIRGSLQTLRQDVGTWFAAPRGNHHSAKPAEFYRMVESMSPGPRLDMFHGSERPGWIAWGTGE